ncbi:uncharacterized protein DUF4124 [Sphaerotilus hippei]|uniref:Uncharacterized protein DUF4124 n=1 Tax=Sphaerotilus hippei TaxID=744406 RepID=A0A318GZ56_9BURK|nr:DUF4124 domain-containing protein [Sphaerotilus hippei]PXW92796.1 uncharacterized protein DUF4124 [Sphaerotilus hippei]
MEVRTLALGCAWSALAAMVHVAPAHATGIYTCVDGKGRKITSDRPIPECADREQAVRNSDGSVRRVLTPSLTAEERAAYEESQRKQMVREAALRDAIRHDRNLLTRFPNEAAHQRARAAALAPAVEAMQFNTRRLDQLRIENKRLLDEAEFYKGKALPRPLKSKIEGNGASIEAQQSAAATHQAEIQRINARYDEELQRLRTLWGLPSGANRATAAGGSSGAAAPAR